MTLTLTRFRSDRYWWSNMRYFLGLSCLALAALGCSDNQNDIGFRSVPDQDGAPSDASAGVAGKGGSGNTSTGGASTGGASTGGASTGGTSSAGTGGAPGGNGGSAGQACTTAIDCPQTSAPCSEARCIGGACTFLDICTGDSGTDGAAGTNGASGLCGNEACTPTRCARIDCGPAVCCQGDTGPTCLHGVSECPPSFAKKELQCWGGNDAGTAALLASCNTAADCFVAKHYTGCCRVEAIGLHVSEFSRFEANENRCGGPPECGCCCDRVFGENGGSGAADTTITVDCVAGVCTTRVP